jgi:antitoxin component of MazEF toxin-antitoxin module
METIVKKWGNSLGIRIPNAIARELSLKDGSFVDPRKSGHFIFFTNWDICNRFISKNISM